eukprot:1158839-Pelagomonas_calceolata.AAC.6
MHLLRRAWAGTLEGAIVKKAYTLCICSHIHGQELWRSATYKRNIHLIQLPHAWAGSRGVAVVKCMSTSAVPGKALSMCTTMQQSSRHTAYRKHSSNSQALSFSPDASPSYAGCRVHGQWHCKACVKGQNDRILYEDLPKVEICKTRHSSRLSKMLQHLLSGYKIHSHLALVNRLPKAPINRPKEIMPRIIMQFERTCIASKPAREFLPHSSCLAPSNLCCKDSPSLCGFVEFCTAGESRQKITQRFMRTVAIGLTNEGRLDNLLQNQ